MIASFFAALSLAACVNVDYMPLNDPPHAMMPRDPAQVQVFATERPARPYVEVANIETQGDSSVSATTVMDKLREEAGKRGCDGLIVTGSNDATLTDAHFGKHGGSFTQRQLRGYRGTCIVFTDAPPESAPPPVAHASL